ncbi:hypothetical protein NJL88_26825 [Streptomyces sp. DK15]|uniref:hypothetical protein n=1 Tax=Streptomyces sp. DK15 TaxID=2957499 RepID=UPI0029AF1BC5|nr:hypothetical protein [Streptomyces sp. DK15]MDX2393608.1 hypothetical protein [Streptomyces sp. DK15]
MIKVGAIAGAVAVAPLILVAPLAVALIGSSNAQAACGGQQGVDTAAVAGQVESVLKGSSSGSVSVPGLDDPKEQVPNAKAIQATGVAMKVPVRGQIVALATALQESGLRNLDYGDRDSLGLFQQRPSQGWGTPEQVRDPVYASTKFYEGLLEVSGWESMTVTQAAQAVQASGFPDAYAKWEPLATALQTAISSALPPAGANASRAGGTPVPAALDAGCTDGTAFGPIPPVRLALQFGMTVSMVTSARSEVEVSALAKVGHLLTNVTVSADSQGAMALGRTTRTAASAVATLDAVDTPSKVLHLTYWDVDDEEAAQLADLVAGTGIDIQLSPVLLSESALRRDGRSIQDSLMQRARDTAALDQYFRLSNGYRSYLDDLRQLQLSKEESHPCRSATLYMSADGEVRHCPYGASEVSVHAPRTEIRAFLDAPATDRVGPDCAAICRPASRDCAAA